MPGSMTMLLLVVILYSAVDTMQQSFLIKFNYRKGGIAMILADKIIKLRKQNGWSQEELADKLNVSRQAVSKWESTASIPDMDKIIKLSLLFEVSTDYLLMDDKEDVESAPYGSDSLLRKIDINTVNTYLDIARIAYHRIAYGVVLCIIAPITLLICVQYSENDPGVISNNTAVAIGLGVLFSLVLIAVMIFINEGMKLAKYEFLEKEVFELEYGVKGVIEKRNEEVTDVFRKRLLISIATIFIAVLQLIIGSLINEQAVLYQVGVLLLMVSFAVFGLVKYGMVKESYTKLLQEHDYSTQKKLNRKNHEGIAAFYWCAVVAVYLGVSFLTMRWDRTWIVWPVAGVLFGGLEAFLNRDSE